MARPKKEQPLVDEKSEQSISSEPLVDEKSEVTIMIIKSTNDLKEGNSYKVSGNVANALIKKGIAKVK